MKKNGIPQGSQLKKLKILGDNAKASMPLLYYLLLSSSTIMFVYPLCLITLKNDVMMGTRWTCVFAS